MAYAYLIQPMETQARFASVAAAGPMAAAGPPGWAAIAVTSAAAGLGMLRGLIAARARNAQQKVNATACADQAEQDMARNRDLYLNDPARTAADKELAVQNFFTLANELGNCCANVGGAPGGRCIEERLRWTGTEWVNGSRYPWATWYLAPILEDQPSPVAAITGPVQDAVNDVVGAVGGIFGGGGNGTTHTASMVTSPIVGFLLVAALGYTAWRLAE